MGDSPLVLPIETPFTWFVCFHPNCASRWVRLIPGRYKHVSCFGQVPSTRAWVFCDPAIDWMRLSVVADEDADDVFKVWTANDAKIVRINLQRKTGRHWRIGFWCVPAVAHILGVRSRAVRPDGFLRELLRQGGELL